MLHDSVNKDKKLEVSANDDKLALLPAVFCCGTKL